MLSIPDMALLGAAALMFFGPEQLPKVARKAGMLIRDVQNTSQSFIREMERAADDTGYGSTGSSFSRAHLIDEAVSPNGTAYTEPYVPSPVEAHVEPALEYAEPAPVHDQPAVPIHDIMPPRAPKATPADNDLPP